MPMYTIKFWEKNNERCTRKLYTNQMRIMIKMETALDSESGDTFSQIIKLSWTSIL